jgi:hypothetical protein
MKYAAKRLFSIAVAQQQHTYLVAKVAADSTELATVCASCFTLLELLLNKEHKHLLCLYLTELHLLVALPLQAQLLLLAVEAAAAAVVISVVEVCMISKTAQ